MGGVNHLLLEVCGREPHTQGNTPMLRVTATDSQPQPPSHITFAEVRWSRFLTPKVFYKHCL